MENVLERFRIIRSFDIVLKKHGIIGRTDDMICPPSVRNDKIGVMDQSRSVRSSSTQWNQQIGWGSSKN